MSNDDRVGDGDAGGLVKPKGGHAGRRPCPGGANGVVQQFNGALVIVMNGRPGGREPGRVVGKETIDNALVKRKITVELIDRAAVISAIGEEAGGGDHQCLSRIDGPAFATTDVAVTAAIRLPSSTGHCAIVLEVTVGHGQRWFTKQRTAVAAAAVAPKVCAIIAITALHRIGQQLYVVEDQRVTAPQCEGAAQANTAVTAIKATPSTVAPLGQVVA